MFCVKKNYVQQKLMKKILYTIKFFEEAFTQQDFKTGVIFMYKRQFNLYKCCFKFHLFRISACLILKRSSNLL